MKNTILTTRTAAQALGVSEASMKRWCDQGLIPVVRTPGGHRRLPVNGVVQFVRERRFEVVQPALLGLSDVTPRSEPNTHHVKDALQTALRRGDEADVRQIVLGAYLGGVPAVRLLDDVVTPAFSSIGDEWAHGNLAIYEEHRAVELCMRLLHQLRMFLPTPAPAAPLAIGGTLAEDPYTLPSTMVEIVLIEAGWRAQSYGFGHPAETLADAMRDARPRLFWLSASAVPTEANFVKDCDLLYRVAEQIGVAVLLGGRALTPSIRAQARCSACCDTLRHAVAFAKAVYPAPSREPSSKEVAQ